MGALCGSSSKPNEDVEPPEPMQHSNPKNTTKYNVEILTPPKQNEQQVSQSESEDLLQIERIVQIENSSQHDSELALVNQQTETLNPARQSQRTESESSVRLTENTAIKIERKRKSRSRDGENILPPLDKIDEEEVNDPSANVGSLTGEKGIGGGMISDDSSRQSMNDETPQKLNRCSDERREINFDLGSDERSEISIGMVYSDDFQAGESGTSNNPNEVLLTPNVYKQHSLSLSDLPSVPETITPNLRNELMNLQTTFTAFRRMKEMKVGHANSILQEQEQTLMGSTTEIHTMIQLYESTTDPEKQLELEIIMERKFELIAKEFGAYQQMLNNDDESSMLFDIGNSDLLSPLMDISDTSEDIPPGKMQDLHEDNEILKLATIPLVSLRE